MAKYDLVHQRYCLAQFSADKDAAIIKRLLSLVKPGGYLQLVDANLGGFNTGRGHEGMVRAMDYFVRAFTEAGLEPAPGASGGDWMREAGAVDFRSEVLSFPVGSNPAPPLNCPSSSLPFTSPPPYSDLQTSFHPPSRGFRFLVLLRKKKYELSKVTAATPEEQHSTTANLCNIVDNFAAMGAQRPNYWYTPEDFQILKQGMLEELATVGKNWRFWVVVGRKPE